VKRTATIAILSVGLTIASAATALAANYPPTPGGGGGGNNSTGTSGGSGLASTGANVSLWMIVLVALVAVGIAALVIGRRRARA
jgi:LPXTG-motif cell wall-anchored protein